MICQRGKSFEVAKGNSLTESSYISAVANTVETLGARNLPAQLEGARGLR